MRSKKFADGASPVEYSSGVSLSVAHGLHTIDVSNPVVFMDISASGGPVPRAREMRLHVELFANVNPLLARNFYSFSTGEFSRVVGGRDVPCGYYSSCFFDAVPGKSLTGGDVITNNGSTNISSLQSPSAAKLSAHALIAKLPASALERCCGFVYAVATAAGTAGSQFRIVFQADSLPEDLSGLIGRVVVRAAEDMPQVVAFLQDCTKCVWSSQRAAANASLPFVALCGEM
jgi:cyclophilin family peptidyl-prolyl cis-trans isomerase